MTQDEMKEHDELFRAEAEQSRERKAGGGDKPARTPRRKAKPAENRSLSHREMAAVYVWRAFELWIEDPAPPEKNAKLMKWIENLENLEMLIDIVSHLMIAVGVGTWEQEQLWKKREAEKQGGVQ